MDKINKTFSSEIKQVGEEQDRVLRFITSTEAEDRDGDIIEIDGWKLDNYLKNPVILYGHNYEGLPVGKSINIQKDSINKKLIQDVKFPTKEEYEFADTVYRLAKADYLNATSVGFIGLQSEPRLDEKGNYLGKRYKKQELLETSIVPVPSNPTALMEARSKGIINDNELKMFEEAKTVIQKPGWDETETSFRFRVRNPNLFQEGTFRTVPIKKDKPRVNSVMGRLKGEDTMTVQSVIFPKDDGWDLDEAKTWLKEHEDLTKGVDNVEEKSIIPFKHFPLADEGTAWNGPRETTAADVEDLKLMCVWYDAENADNKGAYKLPHHMQSNKNTVWRAVAASMAVLLGARGGVDIPANEKRGVYNHLVKHYKEFDKEPPEFRSYSDIELKSMFPEEKAGAELSIKNKERLSKARDLLNEILGDGNEARAGTFETTVKVEYTEELKQALDEIKSQVSFLSQEIKTVKSPDVINEGSKIIRFISSETEKNAEKDELKFKLNGEFIEKLFENFEQKLKNKLNEIEGGFNYGK